MVNLSFVFHFLPFSCHSSKLNSYLHVLYFFPPCEIPQLPASWLTPSPSHWTAYLAKPILQKRTSETLISPGTIPWTPRLVELRSHPEATPPEGKMSSKPLWQTMEIPCPTSHPRDPLEVQECSCSSWLHLQVLGATAMAHLGECLADLCCSELC